MLRILGYLSTYCSYKELMFMRITIILLSSLLLLGCSKDQTSPNSNLLPTSRQISAFEEKLAGDDAPSTIQKLDILTMPNALALTVLHSPELKAYSFELRSAQARSLQASFRPNPELDIELEEFGGSGDRSGFGGSEMTVRFSQIIERNGKREKIRKVASIEEDMANIQYDSKQLDIFEEVSNAFINILRFQEQYELSQDFLKISETTYKAVEKRVLAGKDSPIEMHKASISLSEAKLKYDQSKRNLAYSKQNLLNFWDNANIEFNGVSGDMEKIEPLPESAELLGLLQLNPDYSMPAKEIERSAAIVEVAKANENNDITVGLGITRYNDTDDSTFLVGVSFPLGTASRNQAAKQEASHNLSKAHQLKNSIQQKIKREFDAIYLDLANSYNKVISIQNDILPKTEKMYQATLTAYNEGKADYLSLLDAQRTFFDVKSEYIDSLGDYNIAKTRMDRLTCTFKTTNNNSESEK